MGYAWWLSQILQAIAIVLFALGFQFKRRTMLALFASSAMLTCVHYLLLHQTTGAIVALVVAVRIGIAIRYPGWITGGVFVVVTVIAAAVTWQGPESILAAGGGVLGTVASYMHEGRRQRITFLLASLPWTAYAIQSLSPAGIISEVIILISAIIGLCRYSRSD